MRVRQGWSGQVSTNPDRWAKFDVELEECDLFRLLAGVVNGADVHTTIPVTTAFQLLELEAEILVYVKLITRYGYPATDGKAKLDELRRQKATVLDKIHENVS